jgi:DTW domain-containing protein YfiP
METRTKFVLLMSPKEFKQEKAATGRLTHLCLTNSEIHMGIGFDENGAVQALIDDPGNFCFLLYPSPQARNLSTGNLRAGELGERRLVVFLIDATWGGARKILRHSPSLQRLPRLMFTPSARSRYVIKQQPHENCLSTLEATHELLAALEQAGLDQYPLPEQLLGLFARMQAFQIQCAADPTRPGYRRRPYSEPGTRTSPQGRNTARRNRSLDGPPGVQPVAAEAAAKPGR